MGILGALGLLSRFKNTSFSTYNFKRMTFLIRPQQSFKSILMTNSKLLNVLAPVEKKKVIYFLRLSLPLLNRCLCVSIQRKSGGGWGWDVEAYGWEGCVFFLENVNRGQL